MKIREDGWKLPQIMMKYYFCDKRSINLQNTFSYINLL